MKAKYPDYPKETPGATSYMFQTLTSMAKVYITAFLGGWHSPQTKEAIEQGREKQRQLEIQMNNTWKTRFNDEFLHEAPWIHLERVAKSRGLIELRKEY